MHGRFGVVGCALVALAALAGCDPPPEPPDVLPKKTSQATQAAGPCHPDVTEGRPPHWVAEHFTAQAEPEYSIGRQGEIAAVLYGYPFQSPPKDHTNKILWIAKDAPSVPASEATLHITARLDGSGPAVNRSVDGGPGPSVVDLPEPGCWRLDLTWPGGHRDSLDLRYRSAP